MTESFGLANKVISPDGSDHTTSFRQEILLSPASRRPTDPPGGSDALWLWLRVTGPLVLGHVSVEERALDGEVLAPPL